MNVRASGLSASQVQQVSTPGAPISGGTVQITNSAMQGLTVVNPAGTLAVLTVALPSDANSAIQQIERIAFMKAITLLTISGATTILGAPLAAALGDNIGFQKVAANTWTRVL